MPGNDRTRVLVVDDSAVVRLMLSREIAKDPDLELVGAESSGQTALDKLQVLRPDVVVLDVEMPGLNGVDTVAAMSEKYPRLPVIMFSSYTEEGARITIEALARGAADYVTKPSQASSPEAATAIVRDQLLGKVKVLGKRRRSPVPPAPAVVADSVPEPPSTSHAAVEFVGIAASTGGTNALEVLLPALPANFPVPIVIVQHMPPIFTQRLAERLASKSAIRVRDALSGEPLTAATALIAPGDFHIVVRRTATGNHAYVVTNQGPTENSCRPSADVMFRSAAETFGPHALAVVLTGMGQDGLGGCRDLFRAGGQVIVQDEMSSVVWGMPGSVARAGLASKVLPLERIAAEILRRVLEKRP